MHSRDASAGRWCWSFCQWPQRMARVCLEGRHPAWAWYEHDRPSPCRARAMTSETCMWGLRFKQMPHVAAGPHATASRAKHGGPHCCQARLRQCVCACHFGNCMPAGLDMRCLSPAVEVSAAAFVYDGGVPGANQCYGTATCAGQLYGGSHRGGGHAG